LANDNLKAAEDKLLEFNKASNIINYYEQSKAAVVKEDMEVDYNKMAQLAGNQASTKKTRRKVKNSRIHTKENNTILDKRNCWEINYLIALNEANKEATLMQIFQPK
jgi:hypothetical protein